MVRLKCKSIAFILLMLGGAQLAMGQEGKFIELIPGRTTSPPVNPPEAPFAPSVGAAAVEGSLVVQEEVIRNQTYVRAGEAMRLARQTAKERVDEALSGDRRAAVVVLSADSPFNPRDQPGDRRFEKVYDVSLPIVGNSARQVLDAYLDNTGPQLRNHLPTDEKRHRVGYPIQVFLGTKDANGKVNTQEVGLKDQDRIMAENKARQEAEAKDAADAASAARLRAALKAQEEKTREASLELKRKQDAEADAKREAARREQSRKEFDEARRRRDEACSAGRTAGCLYADSALTEKYEKAEKTPNIALCMHPGDMAAVRSLRTAYAAGRFGRGGAAQVGMGGRREIGADIPVGNAGPAIPKMGCVGGVGCVSCSVRGNALNFEVARDNMNAALSAASIGVGTGKLPD